MNDLEMIKEKIDDLSKLLIENINNVTHNQAVISQQIKELQNKNLTKPGKNGVFKPKG